MGKAEKKITNWAEYNKALCKRGSVTFWIDDSAIDAWRCTTHHGKRGRGFQYSDTAIETALMINKTRFQAFETLKHSRVKLYIIYDKRKFRDNEILNWLIKDNEELINISLK